MITGLIKRYKELLVTLQAAEQFVTGTSQLPSVLTMREATHALVKMEISYWLAIHTFYTHACVLKLFL